MEKTIGKLLNDDFNHYFSKSKGLAVIQIPTGYGKSRAAENYSIENEKEQIRQIRSGGKRTSRIFLITSQNKNLDAMKNNISNGLKDVFSGAVLRLKSRSDTIKELKNRYGERIFNGGQISKEQHEIEKKWKNVLDSYREDNQGIRNKDDLILYERELSKKTAAFRHSIYRYVKKKYEMDAEKEEGQSEDLEAFVIKNHEDPDYKWIFDFYPSLCIRLPETGIVIGTVDKMMLYPCATPFHSYNQLMKMEEMRSNKKNGYTAKIIIDEIDDCKNSMLRYVLGQKEETKGLENIFVNIGSYLNEDSSKDIQCHSYCAEEDYEQLKDMHAKARDRWHELMKKYHVDVPIFPEQNLEKKISADNLRFLFSYANDMSVYSSRIKLSLRYKEDKNYLELYERTGNEEDGYKIQDYLRDIDQFFRQFCRLIRAVNNSYLKGKDREKSDISQSFRSVLNQMFNRDTDTIRFFMNMLYVPGRHIGMKKIQGRRDFWNDGFSVYAVEESADDIGYHIYTRYCIDTPEKYLYSLADHAMVVTMSATAAVPSVLSAFYSSWFDKYLLNDQGEHIFYHDGHTVEDYNSSFDECVDLSGTEIETEIIHDSEIRNLRSFDNIFQNCGFPDRNEKTFAEDLIFALKTDKRFGDSGKEFLLKRYYIFFYSYIRYLKNCLDPDVEIGSGIYFSDALPKKAEDISEADQVLDLSVLCRGCNAIVRDMIGTSEFFLDEELSPQIKDYLIDRYGLSEGVLDGFVPEFYRFMPFVLKTKNFENDRELLEHMYEEGLHPMTVTAYKSIGFGYNLDHKAVKSFLRKLHLIRKDFIKKETETADYDFVIIEKPTAIFPLINFEEDTSFMDESHLTAMYKLFELASKEEKDISPETAEKLVKHLMNGEQYPYYRLLADRVKTTDDYRYAVFARILQAMGRAQRTGFCGKKKYYFFDYESAELMASLGTGDLPLSKETEIVIDELASFIDDPEERRSLLQYQNDYKKQNDLAGKAIDEKLRRIDSIRKDEDDASAVRKNLEQFREQSYHIYSEKDESEKQIENDKSQLYLILPKRQERYGDLYYSFRFNRNETDIYLSSDKKGMTIEEFLNFDVIRKILDSEDYSGRNEYRKIKWLLKNSSLVPRYADYVLSPRALQDLLKGSLGEDMVRMILEKNSGLKLEKMPNRLFEIADFEIRSGSGELLGYCDAKNWNDAANDGSDSQHNYEKAVRKAAVLGKPLCFIQFYSPQQQKVRSTPCGQLIDAYHMDVDGAVRDIPIIELGGIYYLDQNHDNAIRLNEGALHKLCSLLEEYYDKKNH